MLKFLFFGICVMLCACADMGGGHYRMNNDTIGEFFKTGKFMHDKSVAIRHDNPGGSSSGSAVASGGNGAYLEGKILKVKKGCLSGTGTWAKNLGDIAELNFNNGEDSLIVDLNDITHNIHDDCMCYTNSYCEFTVDNVIKKRERTLQGGWMESYDGPGSSISKVISYKKL